MNSETYIEDGYGASDDLSTLTEESCLLNDGSITEDDIQNNVYNPVHSSGSKAVGSSPSPSPIIIRIDNLPPDKNWKQIKYLLGGIIHHSNILQIRLLPPIKSIVPPFTTSQSCIVTLKDSLEKDSIVNLLASINTYKWDDYELYAHILPPLSNITPLKAPLLPLVNFPVSRFPIDPGTVGNVGSMESDVKIDNQSKVEHPTPLAICPMKPVNPGPLGFNYPPPATFNRIPQLPKMSGGNHRRMSRNLELERLPIDQQGPNPPTFLDPQFSPMYTPYPVQPNFSAVGYHPGLPSPPIGQGPLISPLLSNNDILGYQPFSPYLPVLQTPQNNFSSDMPIVYSHSPYGRQTFNPFKQAKNLKNIFNEQNFRKQMTSRGMWQFKLSNFPPYIIPDSLKEMTPLEDDTASGTDDKEEKVGDKTVISTDLTTRYGKLRWTVLKDFIKLKCPKLLHLQDSGSRAGSMRENTREFYVGVYEEEKKKCIVKMDGVMYDAVGVFFSAIVGFHSKKLFDICYKSLEGQEYSMGYTLKIEKLPPS